jgi:hypothetical protein
MRRRGFIATLVGGTVALVAGVMPKKKAPDITPFLDHIRRQAEEATRNFQFDPQTVYAPYIPIVVTVAIVDGKGVRHESPDKVNLAMSGWVTKKEDGTTEIVQDGSMWREE